MGDVQKSSLRRFLPWTSTEVEPEENENENDWMSYIHHSLHPQYGEEIPFPGSEWSYTKRESVFDQKDQNDFDLHQKALDALYNAQDIDASLININVMNGVLLLYGFVKKESDIKRAQEVVQDLSGIWNIRNEIKVKLEN